MDLVKITRVDTVSLAPTPYPQPSTSTKEPLQALSGVLHCTPHHLIFRYDSAPDPDSPYTSPASSTSPDELWLPVPLIQVCTLHPPNSLAQTPLVFRTRDFRSYTIFFRDHTKASLVYESVKAVVNACTSVSSLYALSSKKDKGRGWSIYDIDKEFARMGAFGAKQRSNAWRFTDVNADYEFCSTYPAKLVVPSKVSDVTLKYGKGYRSKQRVPALVYLHWANLGSITRASQPMVGLKNARSIQDEKLIEAIFTSHTQHTSPLDSSTSAHSGKSSQPVIYGAKATNLIIDARPTTNAMANSVKGAGTENMEHYKNCKKAYLGIDNIHVMRESLRIVNDALIQADATGHPPDKHALKRSGWLKHLSAILEGAVLIARNIHIANSHVLVHCSDGWDRTAQLSSLAQLCLDPYYRTIEGFAVLVEKDFLSFGHKFSHRAGHLVPDRTTLITLPGNEQSAQAAFLASVQKGLAFSSAAFKETSPVFQQFLDCVYQIMRQYPKRFQFDQRLLQRLQYELYACQHGTFLYDAEEARQSARTSTSSVWDVFLDFDTSIAASPKGEWLDTSYDTSLDDPSSRASNADMGVLLPDPHDVSFWFQLFNRSSDDMTPESVDDSDLPEVVSALNGDDNQLPVVSIVDGSNGIVDNVGTIPTPQQKWQEEHSQSGTPEGSTTPIKRSASPANPPVEKLQNAMQGLWKFGGSSWKSLKQGLHDYQAQTLQPPADTAQSSPKRSVESAKASSQKDVAAGMSANPTKTKGLQELSLAADPPQARVRDVSTASSIHFPPKQKAASDTAADPLGVS